MSSLADVAAAINALEPPLSGTLRLFGDWFGKPYDNVHSARRATVDGDCLEIEFDRGEKLFIWEPSDVTVASHELRIGRAARVTLEWMAYGRSSRQHPYVIEHVVTGDEVVATSTVDWFEPHFAPSLDHPAVEVLNSVS